MIRIWPSVSISGYTTILVMFLLTEQIPPILFYSCVPISVLGIIFNCWLLGEMS